MHAERERVQDNIQDIMPSSLSSTLSSSSITIHEESTPYIETGPNITSEEEETDPERIYYQYGNLHHLFGSPKGHFPYTCIIGPDWKVLLISYILIIGISLYFTISMYDKRIIYSYLINLFDSAPKIHLWMIITTPFQTLITLLFLSLTACSDAGVVYSNDVDCSQGGVVTCGRLPREQFYSNS